MITYTYDPLYRLVEAEYSTGEFYTYTYDATGNHEAFTFTDGIILDTSVYTYNEVNWLTETNGIDYEYDLNGNLLMDGSQSYQYDGANRLVGVTDGGNTSVYTYDGIGNRVAQTVNAQTTNYTLDVVGGLPEVILAGNTRYLQVGGQVLAQTEAGNWHYIQPDHLGSVRHLTDGAGQVEAYGEYDPFGVPVATYGVESAFGYTGEQEDESGLLFLRARYYDAETGRFLNQDTWGGNQTHPQTLHTYNYVVGNPISYADPTGHYPDAGEMGSGCQNMYNCSPGAYHVSYNDNYTWKENDPRCQANQYCEVEAGISLLAAAVAPGAAQYLLLEGGAVATSQWLYTQGTALAGSATQAVSQGSTWLYVQGQVHAGQAIAQFPGLVTAGAALWGVSDLSDNVGMMHAAFTGNQDAVSELWLTANLDGNLPIADAIGGLKYFGSQAVTGCSAMAMVGGFRGTRFAQNLNNLPDLHNLVAQARSLVSRTSNSPTFAWVRNANGDILEVDSRMWNNVQHGVDLLASVRERARQIGFEFNLHPRADSNGVPIHYPSHADPRAYELSPNTPIGISNPHGPCRTSCMGYFQTLAQNQDTTLAIAYPYGSDLNDIHTVIFGRTGTTGIVAPNDNIYILNPNN